MPGARRTAARAKYRDGLYFSTRGPKKGEVGEKEVLVFQVSSRFIFSLVKTPDP